MEATIVGSGCPRSGTTLIMRILHRGGIPIISEERTVKPIDENHPYGTYEALSAANVLYHLPPEESAGKAIKIVAPTLSVRLWPTDRPIKVIFTLRDPNEIVSSMLTARTLWTKDPVTIVREGLAVLKAVGVEPHFVKYKDLLTYPKSTITMLADYLDRPDFDIEKAMFAVDKDARNKMRKDRKQLIDLHAPRYSLMRHDNNGSILGTSLTAEDLTEEEAEYLNQRYATKQKLDEEVKDVAPV